MGEKKKHKNKGQGGFHGDVDRVALVGLVQGASGRGDDFVERLTIVLNVLEANPVGQNTACHGEKKEETKKHLQRNPWRSHSFPCMLGCHAARAIWTWRPHLASAARVVPAERPYIRGGNHFWSPAPNLGASQKARGHLWPKRSQTGFG